MPKTVDLARIYRATIETFAERGYMAASTKDIAARAGVNEATLYRRFGTKAELIRVSLQEVLATSPFGQLRPTGDVRADMAMIVRAYVETFESLGAVVMVLISEAGRHDEMRGAVGALAPNLKAAAGIIAAHQAAGRIAPGEPMGRLLALIAPLAVGGLAARAGLGVGGTQAVDADEVVRAFLEGHGG